MNDLLNQLKNVSIQKTIEKQEQTPTTIYIDELGVQVRYYKSRIHDKIWIVEPPIWHLGVSLIGSYMYCEDENEVRYSLLNLESNKSNPMNLDASIQYYKTRDKYYETFNQTQELINKWESLKCSKCNCSYNSAYEIRFVTLKKHVCKECNNIK